MRKTRKAETRWLETSVTFDDLSRLRQKQSVTDRPAAEIPSKHRRHIVLLQERQIPGEIDMSAADAGADARRRLETPDQLSRMDSEEERQQFEARHRVKVNRRAEVLSLKVGEAE